MRELSTVNGNQKTGISSSQLGVKLYGYKNLIAWQRADELAMQVYSVTVSFPKSEVFGITSQLRRAALSVPANIIEGYSRVNKKEFGRFLLIAYGSLAEVEYFITFSFKQNFMEKEEFDTLISLKDEVGRLVWRLHDSLTIAGSKK